MYIFLSIYGALALCSFIFYEVLSVIDRRKKNKPFKVDVYHTSHLRVLTLSVFFPIVLLIIVIEAVTETILDRSGK